MSMRISMEARNGRIRVAEQLRVSMAFHISSISHTIYSVAGLYWKLSTLQNCLLTALFIEVNKLFNTSLLVTLVSRV